MDDVIGTASCSGQPFLAIQYEHFRVALALYYWRPKGWWSCIGFHSGGVECMNAWSSSACQVRNAGQRGLQ